MKEVNNMNAIDKEALKHALTENFKLYPDDWAASENSVTDETINFLKNWVEMEFENKKEGDSGTIEEWFEIAINTLIDYFEIEDGDFDEVGGARDYIVSQLSYLRAEEEAKYRAFKSESDEGDEGVIEIYASSKVSFIACLDETITLEKDFAGQIYAWEGDWGSLQSISLEQAASDALAQYDSPWEFDDMTTEEFLLIYFESEAKEAVVQSDGANIICRVLGEEIEVEDLDDQIEGVGGYEDQGGVFNYYNSVTIDSQEYSVHYYKYSDNFTDFTLFPKA